MCIHRLAQSGIEVGIFSGPGIGKNQVEFLFQIIV